MAGVLGGCEDRASARKKKQHGTGEELVNSNSKKFPLK
jgi:hypothetical protein